MVDDSSTNNRVLTAIAEVFQAAQGSYAGHRRHVAVLKKIYTKCLSQGIADVFDYWFSKMTIKILPLKKQEVVGDRIVRLIAGFIATNESELNKQHEVEDVEDLELLEQHFGQFIDSFIRNLLRGVESVSYTHLDVYKRQITYHLTT